MNYSSYTDDTNIAFALLYSRDLPVMQNDLIA